MSKLNPCPFCGAQAQLKEISGRWAVECTNHCAGTRIFNDKEKPIEVWNRRAENAALDIFGNEDTDKKQSECC